ncbi:hypothetical protein [Cyanobium sp. ATX 6F1]|uniref:hypothetical protein n=1 Tax=unclassified Cyanobium TaxID=2627006 RepID=UPI0020CFABD3|nr:hypothetical protein [Cyanobium sp. ATX 6F1]MCP9915292.1 hypothetical protein [Cyanobium sp. ATX 6F1]
MTNSIAEIILGYGFTLVLFVGLPAVLFLMIFLPGLMRTTGETVGASGPKGLAIAAVSKKVALRRAPQAPLTMLHTA